MMSSPFTGAPTISFNLSRNDVRNQVPYEINGDDLAALQRQRKHYQDYYRSLEAKSDIMNSKDGLASFIRAYYHHKSADWECNAPHPLDSLTAEELAKMPTYYIMDLDDTMPEAVSRYMPTFQEIKSCKWLTYD